ncbi:uncharacterized protein LOC131663491 [Phymastichus coffea]|uniref:uncharacterized protein LOC131663491 n=1 Tax=Phymastichus coffea TaxID=108790 RepID=UPI00273B0C9D|nr:uncharacterized protein LOC131663491 [Phymastichus coffea]
MVRNYIRKSNRQQWGKNHMMQAISAITKGGLSFNMAAVRFSVPKSTLIRYYHRAKNSNINLEEQNFKLGSFKTTFTGEQEKKLKQYIKDFNLSLRELSPLELRRIAFKYAEINGISHNFNKKTKLAGYDWYKNFIRRNEIEEKSKSEPSIYISSKLNVDYNIDTFFPVLNNLQQLYKFPPNRIYSVHDRGVISIPNLSSKIFSAVDKTMSTFNFLTVITCSNANGNFIPPLLIYPSKEDNPDFAKGCPTGTKIICQPSGCIQENTFLPTWFYHFVNYVQPIKEYPVLLLLNEQGLCMKNIQLIEEAKMHNIHILNIPVTLSDRCYPLEKHFMTELKKYYCEEQDKWTKENKGRVIDLECVGTIFSIAYTKAIVPNNVINGFKESGIYPLNQSVLTGKDNTCIAAQLIEKSTSISIFTESNNSESSLNKQIENCRTSIEATGDIVNSFNDTKDTKYFLLDNFNENHEESNSKIEIVQEDGGFETIYQEEIFEYCD